MSHIKQNPEITTLVIFKVYSKFVEVQDSLINFAQFSHYGQLTSAVLGLGPSAAEYTVAISEFGLL